MIVGLAGGLHGDSIPSDWSNNTAPLKESFIFSLFLCVCVREREYVTVRVLHITLIYRQHHTATGGLRVLYVALQNTHCDRNTFIRTTGYVETDTRLHDWT